MPTPKTTNFRGVGGEYLIQVQAADEFYCADEWLKAVLVAGGGVSTRVYNGPAPETAVLTDNTGALTYITFASTGADPDGRAYGDGAQVVIVANLRYEVVFWKQGQTFAGLSTGAAAIRPLLDVGNVTTAHGTIIGCKRVRPIRGTFSRKG